MYFVYILFNEKDNRTYTGYTSNLEARLKLHNSGQVRATKYRRPLKLLISEQFNNEHEAKERELWWKSSSGRKELKKVFDNIEK